MKTKMATYTKALLLLVVLMGVTACQDDETIYDRIVGRVWVGDLGFGSDNDPIESAVNLGGDGFGTDDQWCYEHNEPMDLLNIRWWIEDGSLFIDYGRLAGRREIRYVYVSKGRLSGDLYINNTFFDTVTLEMSN